MATQKSNQAAPAASVNESSKIVLSAERVLALALGTLEDMADEQERVLSVAVAGGISANDNVLERHLFRVIQDMTEGIEPFAELRSHIEALARCAGVQVEVQS